MLRNFELKPKDFLSQISNDVGVLRNVVGHTELIWLDLQEQSKLHVIKYIILTLKMTLTQVVKTTATVMNSSSFRNYTHPEDHTRKIIIYVNWSKLAHRTCTQTKFTDCSFNNNATHNAFVPLFKEQRTLLCHGKEEGVGRTNRIFYFNGAAN